MKSNLLSRVGEHFYWFGRYVERAENTARLIIANANVALDLPRRSRLEWYSLVEITGSEPAFAESEHNPTELGVLRFLIADRRNPGSIASSLSAARENLRSTRDRVPREVSESVNTLYSFVNEHADGAIRRTSARFDLLRGVIDHCQIVRGYLAGTMSRGMGLRFIHSGQMLERADMTTRIMDVRLEDLLPDDVDLPPAAESLQWMAVLRSLSAYQMYRRYSPGIVKARSVFDFLLLDEQFPRSVVYCLQELRSSVAGMPRHTELLKELDRALAEVTELRGTVRSVDNARLHDTVDDLQREIHAVHSAISNVYFHPVPSTE